MTEFGYHAAAMAARRLPPWLSDPIAACLADLYVATHPSRARDVSRRLKHVWEETRSPGCPPSARETYRAFAGAVRDFLASSGAAGSRVPHVRVEGDGARNLGAARASGAPTLVVSGHFGPWEVALQWLAREVGPVGALAAPHRCSAVERFFRAQREAHGVRTLNGGRPVAQAIECLRTGGWVAVLADRALRARAAARHPIGGGLVAIDRAPLMLARRAGAQVLAGVAWREADGGVAVQFHAPFLVGPDHGSLDPVQAEQTLQRFFDAHVRTHPTQWFDWNR